MIDQVLVIVGITFLVLISPGPDMVIVLRNTLVGGRSAGMDTSLGILTGNMVHITYCVLGIGWLISNSIVAFNVLKYAGAIYLIYLGVTGLLSGEQSLDPDAAEPVRRDQPWFVQGFINNLLNPKGTLFYLGVFSVVITPDTSTVATVVLIAIMQSMCLLFWIFFVYTLDRPAIRQGIERVQTAVHRVFGVLLVALGIRVMLMDR
jgi:RhtB (resistance to homoserine/threonine) family protein